MPYLTEVSTLSALLALVGALVVARDVRSKWLRE